MNKLTAEILARFVVEYGLTLDVSMTETTIVYTDLDWQTVLDLIEEYHKQVEK